MFGAHMKPEISSSRSPGSFALGAFPTVFHCLAFLVVFFSGEGYAENIAGRAVESFTGAHTRVVWIQQQSGGPDQLAFGNHFQLAGLDSRDGKGERILLGETRNYYKPLFTPDGRQVIVSNRVRHRMQLVDFETHRSRPIGDGVAIEVWEHPGDGTVWVYALAGDGPEDKYSTTHALIRFPLDAPHQRELVWDKTRITWSNFNVSRDGRFASGLFPWPHAGIMDLEQKTWKPFGKGCWTALSPDNRYILWVFDGSHRNLTFFDPKRDRRWTTPIDGAPGIRGNEVYHPRWSDHPRYLSLSGPYVDNGRGGDIREVEIYLGRLHPELTAVEAWQRVTHNDKADYYPEVWIEAGADRSADPGLDTGTSERAATTDGSLRWSVAETDMVFTWKDRKADNQLAEESPAGYAQSAVTAHGRSIFNRFQEMDLRGGGFRGRWNDQAAALAFRSRAAFGVELLFTPKETDYRSVGPIFRYREHGLHGNDFVRLLQAGRDLRVTVSISPNGAPFPLLVPGIFRDGQPVHLVLAMADRTLRLYVDGELVQDRELPVFPYPLWSPGSLLFGTPEKDASDALDGGISHAGVYAGELSGEQVLKNAEIAAASIVDREELQRIRFTGEVVEASRIPSPDALGAYRRALVVHRYRILRIHDGAYEPGEILVAQWAVLDRKVLPEASRIRVGFEDELAVERFDRHPELEGERLMMDLFDPELDLYYRVNP